MAGGRPKLPFRELSPKRPAPCKAVCGLRASGHAGRRDSQALFDFVGQLVSPFTKCNITQKMFTLLYGYKSDNEDYHYTNIEITLAVKNFLIQTKRFVY